MRCARSALALAVVAMMSTMGCRIGQLMTRNLAAFGEERSLPNRITHPERPDARLAVLWVGHATALIQMEDKFILTDPVFTETIGQLSPRLVEPGIAVENLPPIDAVLISHMHFDHMSLGSLEMLASKVRWLGLPRGGLVYLTDFAFPAREVPWWTSQTLAGGLRVTSVPVQHNGWRYGMDRDWRQGGYTGWVIEYRGMTVYFSGDTALNAERFRATAQRFPSIDLALLPISPIHPRDYMHKMHVDPNEALTAFELLGARWMVPVHHDTFVNSLDEAGEPKRVLLDAMEKRGLNKTRVAVLEIGEQRVFIER